MVDSRHIQSVLDGLQYDFDAFELDHFVQYLEVRRGRSVIRVPYNFEPGLTGLWIPAETADYIFYTQFTHSIHQVHIILHEIAHMLLEHPCKRIDQILPVELVNTLRISDKVLSRSSQQASGDVEELEAESFVYRVQERIVAANRLSYLTNGQSSIEGLNRFTDSLGLMKRTHS